MVYILLCQTFWEFSWCSSFMTIKWYFGVDLDVYVCLIHKRLHQDLSSQSSLIETFLVSHNKSILLLTNNMSLAYKIKKICLLPLNFWYMHSSTIFILKSNESMIWWNLWYHWRETCLSLYIDFFNLQTIVFRSLEIKYFGCNILDCFINVSIEKLFYQYLDMRFDCSHFLESFD